MRKYFEIEDELLEAKADEKPVTFFVVYRTWNEKNFNHIPSDGLVMSIIPTSYKTVKLAIKNKEKFATVPFIAYSLDKIEIYEVLDDMTMGDYKSLKHYERESLLTKCKLVYEEDLRNKNEEYERGYRAGRREVLREAEEKEEEGIFSEYNLEKLIQKYGLKIVNKSGKFYTLSDSGRNIGTGFGFIGGKIKKVWIKLNMEDTVISDVEYYGKSFDNVRDFYRELKDSI